MELLSLKELAGGALQEKVNEAMDKVLELELEDYKEQFIVIS